MSEPTCPIAITMGDAAGIGPEITLKLLDDDSLIVRPIVIGDVGVLRDTAERLGLALEIVPIAKPAEARCLPGRVDVVEAGDVLSGVRLGQVSASCGAAAYAYIRQAIDYAKAGDIRAIVTAPIHKEALSAAGVPYPGHTEMLADFGGAQRTAMMLANDQLRVVLVTIHCALREAIDRITVQTELDAIRLAHEAGKGFGMATPRVAVAGLNPHAGEGGLFGGEEIEIISPAIKQAKAEGIDVSGPWAGDTVFMQARQGRFDVVVAQYHDQGLIPIKYLGLEEGVNITLGLPFIRTSPDHGTAFDIAGKGVAEPASMGHALDQALRLIAARNKS
jgi:4-hydroxythreonine-4-phosphate dehydrogenase